MPENNGAQEGPSLAATSEAPKIRIVVADDHPIFRDGLAGCWRWRPISRLWRRPRTAGRCWTCCNRHEPDILLLDLKMPGLDGLATLQRLQTSKHKTRVIVLTASDDKNEFVQAMKLGTSGIVLEADAPPTC